MHGMEDQEGACGIHKKKAYKGISLALSAYHK
jgi:hypothetical protein